VGGKAISKLLLANCLLWGELAILRPILLHKWEKHVKIRPLVGRQPMKIELANSIFQNPKNLPEWGMGRSSAEF